MAPLSVYDMAAEALREYPWMRELGESLAGRASVAAWASGRVSSPGAEPVVSWDVQGCGLVAVVVKAVAGGLPGPVRVDVAVPGHPTVTARVSEHDAAAVLSLLAPEWLVPVEPPRPGDWALLAGCGCPTVRTVLASCADAPDGVRVLASLA